MKRNKLQGSPMQLNLPLAALLGKFYLAVSHSSACIKRLFCRMSATCFVQPLDLVKNRMQMSGIGGKKEYRSSFHALRSIVAKEGVLAVYNGLSAGLLRQATYTTTRLGVYTWLFEKFCRYIPSTPHLMIFNLILFCQIPINYKRPLFKLNHFLF